MATWDQGQGLRIVSLSISLRWAMIQTLRYEGEGSVIVETPEGSQKLTINLYEDIMEIQPDGSKKIIAESDLPHGDFTKLGTKRATSWTIKEGEAV